MLPELEGPNGLLLSKLYPHQKQALYWMVYRESQDRKKKQASNNDTTTTSTTLTRASTYALASASTSAPTLLATASGTNVPRVHHSYSQPNMLTAYTAAASSSIINKMPTPLYVSSFPNQTTSPSSGFSLSESPFVVRTAGELQRVPSVCLFSLFILLYSILS